MVLLGSPTVPTPCRRVPVDESVRVPAEITRSQGDAGALEFELAGPRAQLYFEPGQVRAGILTCGGLCPGMNNVIRSVFLELHHAYGVTEVLGFRGGYAGLDPQQAREPVRLTPDFVEDIHKQGGTVLCTSRGPVDIARAVDNLIARGVNMLFVIGGDGTLRGGNALFLEAQKRGYALAVVGIPKTVDNDVPFVSRSFGYLTAVQEAAKVLHRAHVEARSVFNGIALVKVMGRHAGFIAAGATVASQDANFTLIPEVPFALEGEGGFLMALQRRIEARAHALIVLAEGAGQELLSAEGEERDASGNLRLQDIGVYLRERIEAHFKQAGIPAVMRYFDPNYFVRSSPANSEDAILCDMFARHAVHAAMAGHSGIVIGYLHDRFVHVPITELVKHRKALDPESPAWGAVLAATGQAACFG